MDRTAADAWNAMTPAWQTSFEEAWASWCEGNLGIGAALLDPETDEIVSVGRNRIAQRAPEPGLISGNFMAHAEMNALAALPRFNADGLDLYTTLEPCLMCAGTTVFLHVGRVHFAAADEYFEGVDRLWGHHPYSRRWQPDHIGPLTGPMAAFARSLPLSVVTANNPDGPVMTAAHQASPAVAALAVELANDRTLQRVKADDGSALDALAAVWERLPAAGDR